VISDSVDHLRIHDNPESFRGCRKGTFSQTKLNRQRIFVWLLNQPVAKRVKNLYGTADNLKNFFFGQQLSTIRVHSCSLVVNHELESMRVP